MKLIALGLIGLLAAAPAVQAQAPLEAQARAALVLELERAPADPSVVIRDEMESPIVFWTGVGLLAAGVFGMVAAVTFERESDLSDEYRTVRLGRDLAPCGTDPIDTILPIADCQVNAGLLWVGAGVATLGGGMMWFGGRQIQHVRPEPAPGIRFTVKW